MALGRSTFEISSGGGSTSPGAQELSRQLVLLGVSPGGTVNVLAKPQSEAAIRALYDRGPLAEAMLKCMVGGAPVPMGIALSPSVVGGVSAVTQGGSGAGAIAVSIAPHRAIQVYCTLGGALGTMKVKFSLDGGATFGPVTTSAAGWSSTGYRVPGTFTTLTFGAATYVIDKICTIGVNGVVTNGSGWVGVVAQTSSPIDVYDVVATVEIGGALGTAVLAISMDGGRSTIPSTAIPSGGVVVIPDTGLVLTCTNAFTALDTYSFLAGPPGYSTSDLTAAITALRADATAPRAALLVLIDNAASPAGGFAAGAALDTAIDTAFASNDLDWMGRVNVPCSEGALGGDIIVSGGAAARVASAASGDIRTAREGLTFDRVGVVSGAHRVTSAITGWQQQRPTNVVLARRYAQTTPKQGVASRAGSPLEVEVIGRDELTATTTLHDVQVDTLQTIRGETGAWLAIQSGGFGFRNLTLDAQYQDADFLRIVNAAVAALRLIQARLIGERPKVNSDGTIDELAARRWDGLVDRTIKRATGLAIGGSFDEAQVSEATASIDRSSQLGTSPRELVIQYGLQGLGFISSVRGKLRMKGAE